MATSKSNVMPTLALFLGHHMGTYVKPKYAIWLGNVSSPYFNISVCKVARHLVFKSSFLMYWHVILFK